jgi:hypothetical protein
MTPVIQFKTIPPLLVALLLVCFGLAPIAQAVGPDTDGAIPGSNNGEGTGVLVSRTTGIWNNGTGFEALNNLTSGNQNTATGFRALFSDINDGFNTQIFDATSSGGTAVFINSNGRLGTATSSRRFKEEIKAMERASEALFALKPVTFRYKNGIDPQGIPQFGLVAEDVEAVNPDLVVRDKEGKPYSVRYEQVNAMLLNEFLKEHRKVEDLEATVAQQRQRFHSKLAEQQKQIEALASGLQKVTAKVEMKQPAPKVVVNQP